MGLVTCCPKCKSEYDVTADQLKLHDGLVRCGQCSHVFDGFAALKNALPTLTRKVADEVDQSAVPPSTSPSLPPSSTPVLSHRAIAPEPALSPHERVAPVPVATPSSAASAGQALASDFTSPYALPESSTNISTDISTDGPFIPSVDRAVAVPGSGVGRQEPSFGQSAAVFSGRHAREPGFGSLTARTTGPEAREPRLGGFASGEAESARQEPAIDSQVRVIGESRVKGDDPSAFGRTVPEFLEDEEEVSEGVSVLWVVGSILLGLILIVQSLIVFRNDMVSALPELRPFLVQLCKPLSCEVSYVRRIERIFIVGSSLQQAPDAKPAGNQRAYVLRLTLQNRSTYEQPWPALMLTLTDASGTAVVKKALLPSQYLPPSLLQGPIAPRQEVGLDIPLAVDGLTISGYELERFFP